MADAAEFNRFTTSKRIATKLYRSEQRDKRKSERPCFHLRAFRLSFRLNYEGTSIAYRELWRLK
jgi:hypothetical protein